MKSSTPGVFDDDRYFDVFVEYAKATPEDVADPRDRRKPSEDERATACLADNSGLATRGLVGHEPKPSIVLRHGAKRANVIARTMH